MGMITVRLLYGLGNMMFQVAFLEYMGWKFGHDTCYPNFTEQIELLKKDPLQEARFYADDYHKIFRNFDWLKNNQEPFKCNYTTRIPFGFVPIKGINDGTRFIGYFQSEKYWDENSTFVRFLFEPSDFVVEQLARYEYLFDGVTCCIHVRRGDYLNLQHYHPVVTSDYINRAKLLLSDNKVAKFLVFSDDIPWCKENLIGDEYFFIENEKDYVELFLMVRCDYKIISNSTFSWWGAYLSGGKGTTIAPKIWVTKPRTDDSDVCPQTWRRV